MSTVRDVTVPAGDGWSGVVKKGQTLRIIDLEGNQAVDTLLYNAHDFTDRYSAVDTICAQRNIYLGKGTKLLTQNGNVLMTITEDLCGYHDTLGGACSQESNMVRYDIGKRYMHACRQTFLKYGLAVGLEKRDLSHNINFFMNVPVTPDGKLTFEDGLSAPGKYLDLLAAMDTLVLISNCPQLNNPCNAYNPTPVRLVVTG
ncbi:MAG: urea amidolyase associated protein UAAP2 [Bryobacteraceae bacterium]